MRTCISYIYTYVYVHTYVYVCIYIYIYIIFHKQFICNTCLYYICIQILAGKVTFPRHLDRQAKSLIKKLLVADLTKRYGCLKAGAIDIKKHKWFQDFDWELLLVRQHVAPIIPSITGGEGDTSNFDPYPDSLEEAPIPDLGQSKDPFSEF
jgi:protein kinase A